MAGNSGITRTHLLTAILLAALVSPFLNGCDGTNVDPFVNDEKYFTVYGYLDELTDNQALRVIPVTRRGAHIPDPLHPNAMIDAVVTTIDTVSGVTTTWYHDLMQLSDGSYGHVFRASFNVKSGRTYRLEITRNDGKKTTAVTTVPNLFSTRVLLGPKHLADNGDLIQDLTFPGVTSPWDILVIYRNFGSVYLPYGRAGASTEDGNWRMTINFNRDIQRLAGELGIPEADVRWSAMGIRAQVLATEWAPPLDIFAPELLSQPGAFSNVVNGYGYFGSVGLLQDDWPDSR